MKLFAIHGGGERADMAAFNPFDEKVGTKVDIPYFFYVIEHPKGLVLFDTGGHPDLFENPRLRLGDAADVWEVTGVPGDDVVSKLAEMKLKPTDIGQVVQSHLHYDHAGGLQFFKHATVYVQKSELEFAYSPPVYQKDLYIRDDFDHKLEWVSLEGSHDVFGDGRLVIFPTPGHTRGHQSMLVKLEAQNIILVADAAYIPKNMEQRLLTAVVWSPDAMVASWERIEEVQARENAKLIFTHDLDWSSKTRLAPKEWYE